MRCTSPGVPGTAHGRASRSSRAYGRKPSPLAVAKSGSISGRSSTSGSRHGSEEFDRNVSESTMTGVRYRTAMRAASSAIAKQSAGEAGATIGIGLSP